MSRRLKRFLAASALASAVTATPVAASTVASPSAATPSIPGVTTTDTSQLAGQPSCVGCWAVMTEV